MSQPPEPLAALSPEEVAQAKNVSRETMAKFQTYLDLLRKWQSKINLVGPATLGDPWRRHFLDSVQLYSFIPTPAPLLYDLGSGAGFPGLVLALMGQPQVRLIDSDQRKCAFLQTVAQATGLKPPHLVIDNRRIEALADLPPADVITARACAPLSQLLAWAMPLTGPRTVGLFLKGAQADQELAEAAKDWIFVAETFPSETDPQGKILRVSGLQPRPKTST